MATDDTFTDDPSTVDEQPASLELTDVFRILANTRRRLVLHHLAAHRAAVPIAGLVERVAGWIDDGTVDAIHASLYHHDLPILVDAGLVRHAADEETIELLESAAQLVPYLETVAPHDVGDDG